MPDNNQAVTVRKRGRPTVYTDEIAAEILERLASGESLRAVCRAELTVQDGKDVLEPREPGSFPTDTAVRLWHTENQHGFSSRYARARDCGWDAMAEQAVEIADSSTPEGVHVARLQVDTRKWILSKLCKRYGDRLTVSGDADAPIVAEPDTKDLARRVAFILAMGEDEAESEA